MSHLKKFLALGMTVATVASIMPMTSLAAHYDEWVQKDDGKWYYYNYEGVKKKYTSQYDKADGKYYVLNSKGARVVKKGWYTTNYVISNNYDKVKFKTKYYLNSDGSATIGWKKISGKYYFFDNSGCLCINRSAFFYNSETGKYEYILLGSDGTRIKKKGWHKVTEKYVDYDGYVRSSKVWYYVKSDGNLAIGKKKIGGKTYCFSESSGELVVNSYTRLHNSKTSEYEYYATDKNGVIITKKGLRQLKNTYTEKGAGYSYKETNSIWVYVKKDGTLHTGFKKIDGKTYYFGPRKYVGESYKEYGTNKKYYFGKSGVLTKTITLKS